MKDIVKRILRSLTYRVGYQNLDPLSFLLYSRLHRVDTFHIVQIGANDGKTNDPLHAFMARNHAKIRALLLEPLGDYYAELAATYQQYPNVKVLKLAIHSTATSMVLHRVDRSRLSSLPAYARGVASFDARHHEKSNLPADSMTEETVDCVTMEALIATHGLTRIDCLCIDTEGYDAEILRAPALDAVRPRIILFEHGLSQRIMSDETFAEVVRMLIRRGYHLIVLGYDVAACLHDELGIE